MVYFNPGHKHFNELFLFGHFLAQLSYPSSISVGTVLWFFLLGTLNSFSLFNVETVNFSVVL